LIGVCNAPRRSIAVNGNPLDDIGELTRVAVVVAAGTVVHNDR
jgi:hypothetical protein